MAALTTWDRIATLGDPVKQQRRLVARSQNEFLTRSAEGDGYEAGGWGRRLMNWLGGSSGPNAQVAQSLAATRARHRDLCRNNSWAKRAAQAIVTHTVGHGLMVEFKSKTDKKSAAREQALAFVNALFAEWFDGVACDHDGARDGYMQQAAALNDVVRKGDVLVRARWLRGSDNDAVPLRIQLIPADFLDENKTEMLPDGGKIVQGVQFGRDGRRVGYWLFDEHPHDLIPARDPSSRFVPASDIAHVYRADEIGQVRGMPWGYACLVPLKELDGYEDAYMFRQKLANCAAGFVHDTDAPSFNPASTTTKSVLPDSLEPGAMIGLPPGKKVSFNTPPLAGDYGPFVSDKLYEIAAGYGITHAMLTGRYDKLNFTSGRMGYMDVSKNIDDWRWLMLVPQMVEPICRWFLEAVSLKYGFDTSFMAAEITPPKRELMDPPREVPSEIKALRAGLWSQLESWRARGMRPKRVVAEIAEFNKMVDAAKVVLDTDARHVNAQGAAQIEPKEPADEPGASDE